MRSPRVTTDAYESMPLGMVPEADRYRVAEKKLWRIRSILQTDLRVAAGYLAELQQFDAWRLFKCGSMAEFVEQRGLRLDDELLSEIRSKLQPATDDREPAPPADAVEEPEAAGDQIADASALLDELKAAGVRVEARGDRLRLLPASAVDEALVARVRPHKTGLLALLEARSRPAVAEPLPLAATTPTACEPLKHEPEPAGRDDRGWTRYVCRKCGRFYGYAPDAPAALRPTLEPT